MVLKLHKDNKILQWNWIKDTAIAKITKASRKSVETSKHLCKLYVPVTVHREQSVKKEYQQDATI